MTTKLPSLRLAALASTFGMVAVSGVACGATTVDPIRGPEGDNGAEQPGDPQLPGASHAAEGTQTPGDARGDKDGTKRIPDQPVGPYTAEVGTTDVSILYPMPSTGASVDFLRPTEIGNHGELLPKAFVTAVQPGQLDEEGLGGATYEQFALVSV
ncbi:MAG TPA: hypothetical protein VM925_10770, partial [Labilithrix sp.]|nr:hypothetical protein [Labilithrix sp.]